MGLIRLIRPGRFRGAKSFDNAWLTQARGYQPRKRRTLQPGPNYANRAQPVELCYISLASPALSLQATSTRISSLHEHVAAQKILESLKNWSGHGLSNRTGSAVPVCSMQPRLLALPPSLFQVRLYVVHTSLASALVCEN